MNNLLKNSNISGYLYFYIHLVTEVLCFYILSRLVGDSAFLWMMPLFYDTFAFVPQSLIGYLNDKYRKINFGLIGIVMLLLGFLLFFMNIVNVYIAIFILCLGNAFIHISGAEITLRSAKGKMAPSAIFVSGGSFGVIIGKLLSKINLGYVYLIAFGLTMIPFCLLAEYDKFDDNEVLECRNYNYQNLKIKPAIVILFTFLIVVARGYMGYGIPTSWNKTIGQTVLLYSFMGFGKALGGILIDKIGMRKTSVISIIGALPFLLVGDKMMIVSLIGVMLFSMTMAVTLGLLVSVLKDTPGLAFGLTTIGLFLGTVPIFIFKINSIFINSMIILILSLVCLWMSLIIIRKERRVLNE